MSSETRKKLSKWTLILNRNTNVIFLVECEEFLAFAFLLEERAHHNTYITMSTIRNGQVKSWSVGNRDVAGALRLYNFFDPRVSIFAQDAFISHAECERVQEAYDKGERFLLAEENVYRYTYKIHEWQQVKEYLERRSST